MELSERDTVIRKMAEQGLSLTTIGRIFDISRERVRQICPYNGNGRRPTVDHDLEPDYEKIKVVLDRNEVRSFAEVGRKAGLPPERVRKVLLRKLGDVKVRELSNKFQLGAAKAIVKKFLKAHPDGLITMSNLSRVVGYSSACYVNRRASMAQWRKMYGQPEVLSRKKYSPDGITILKEA